MDLPHARKDDRDRMEALGRERRSQLRGLLLLAALTLLYVLVRARPLHLFHRGWQLFW